MKSDIDFNKVENIQLVAKPDSEDENNWRVILINENPFPLENVIVASKGYSEKNDKGNQEKTSILRHFFERVEAENYIEIETIIPEVFELFNEYWVSYYIDRKIYDKKFIFVPGSLSPKNFTFIKRLGVNGVLHS